ncbi:MAG: hypothetical protein M3Y42_09435 [Actinomycetota bacterium]|nr:hypothetical protein [Actinomycetota bacterium]MDQ2957172.1 hypothetical protein [Actinomycetota bacterium]
MTEQSYLTESLIDPDSVDAVAAAPCEAVRFYGRELHIALTSAAEYLREWQQLRGQSPSVVALHDEFSWEDSGHDIAWQLTLVLREASESPW